jgi:hypothetical protein
MKNFSFWFGIGLVIFFLGVFASGCAHKGFYEGPNGITEFVVKTDRYVIVRNGKDYPMQFSICCIGDKPQRVYLRPNTQRTILVTSDPLHSEEPSICHIENSYHPQE